MDNNMLFVLGAPDPEMQKIQEILDIVGVENAVAMHQQDMRCNGSNAYSANHYVASLGHGSSHAQGNENLVLVECKFPHLEKVPNIVVLDHHHPGDPGYGIGPVQFLQASSIGQVLIYLADKLGLDSVMQSLGAAEVNQVSTEAHSGCVFAFEEVWRIEDGARSYLVPSEIVLTAAADHCPAAAYQGACPGVEEEEIREFRIKTRAQFQGRSVAYMEHLIQEAEIAILNAPAIRMGGVPVADLRSGVVPEAPEASLRLGIPFLGMAPMPAFDKRKKCVLLGAGADTKAGTAPIDAFLGGWARKAGMHDMYGDGARGFAGAYLTPENEKENK